MTHDKLEHACAHTNGQHDERPGLDCSLSVHAVVTIFPSTLPVFKRFGLDTCCGGGLSVVDAARAADVDTDALCGALHEVIAA